MSDWVPLLEGADAAGARAAIEAIATDLRAVESAAPDLFDGWAGFALFFAQLGDHEHARRCLERAIEASDGKKLGLFLGITGIGFAVEHLAPDLDAGLDDLDEAIARSLTRGTPSLDAEIDLVGGLVGIGVYAAERAPRPTAMTILARIGAWFEAIAERTGEGTSFRTPASRLHAEHAERYPQGGFQLGLAHGVAGIVGFLGVLARMNLMKPELVASTTAWLHAQEIPGGMALFSTIVGDPDYPMPPPSRTAWCWGGPGIAAALHLAACATEDRLAEERACALALAATTRPFAELVVKDACLCHGAAGLGLVYARFFDASGDGRLADASRSLFRRAIAMRAPGSGIGGYSTFTEHGPERMPGLVMGSAGVGLALLAATTEIAPAWDRMMLLSARVI